MPRSAVWLLAVLGLAALTVVCVLVHAPEIERELGEAARRALAEEGLRDVASVRMDGRDAIVSAEDPTVETRAEALVGRVDGIRRVRTAPRTGQAPALEAPLDGLFSLRSVGDGEVALYGPVSSATVRDRLLASARRAFPAQNVLDGLTIDSTADDALADGIARALLRLRTVREPGLGVTADTAFVVSGAVETEAARANTITRMAEIVEPRDVLDRLTVSGDSALAVAEDTTSAAPASVPPPDTPSPGDDESDEAAPPDAPARLGSPIGVEDNGIDPALARRLRDALGGGIAAFEPGTDRLTPGSADALRRAAPVLLATPGVIIELQGHADPSESGAFDLSARRARAAKRVLTEAGVPFRQIEAAAYSASTPVDRSGTPEAQALNRRVVLKLLRRR
ncbi:MAG: OmpA family protein [Bacteroidota bacterium]